MPPNRKLTARPNFGQESHIIHLGSIDLATIGTDPPLGAAGRDAS